VENKTYKITQTLLNSFNYFLKSEGENALADFEKVIRKEYQDNKYTLAGKQWENEVCHNPKSKLAKEVHEKIKDCDFQAEVSKEIEVNNRKILLYGFADAIGYDIIYDIKTTSSDYEIGKYQTSLQHKIYMFCTGIKQFEYLLTKINIKEHECFLDAEGASIPEYEIIPADNFGEYDRWQDSYEGDIHKSIDDFFNWLNISANEENKKIFNEKWTLNK
jgi:hypothetical protein